MFAMQNSMIGRRGFVGVAGAAVLGAAVFGLAGCGSSDDSSAVESDLSGSITAAGSTAMQPLVEAAAELFQEKNPDVQITVQGGGSGEGLAQVADGSVQIGNSDLFAEDLLSDAQAAGLVDHRVAVVSMGPVAHPDVDVASLSREQLRGIFTGEITNWSEVGGQDLDIVVIIRAEGSGTRIIFENYVLDGDEAPSDFAPQEEESSEAVVEMIQKTAGAISYLAFPYYDEDKFTCLQIDGTAPTANNVVTNDWPIWTYEHMYVAEDVDEATSAFVEFMEGSDMEGIVTEHGYIRVGDMKVEKDADGTVTEL